MHFSFGIHPQAISQKWMFSQLAVLLCHPKSVAAGKMGLTLIHCFKGDEGLVTRYSKAFKNVVFSIRGLIFHGNPDLAQAIRID